MTEKALSSAESWPVTSAKQEKSKVKADTKKLLRYFGPAFIVSVAYIDPGNFGTNISGGSLFKYDLLWVILASNLMAIFLQCMSAKLGIASGKNLPELCSGIFNRKVNWGLWSVAVTAAMATDLAEFLGAALGFYLLLHIPMVWAGLLTGLVTFILVQMEKYGHRLVEGIIAGLVAVVSISYVLELFLAKPPWGEVASHLVVPQLSEQSIFIAVGMLGATVMPHVIFLHSQLVQPRRQSGPADTRLHLKLEKIDIMVAMNIAFIVNAAMVIVSGTVFHSRGLEVLSIEQAHQTLQPLLGSLSSGAFGIALLASGLSSSVVGTMAGQVIMKGFVNLEIPLVLRRLVTMAPAMLVLGMGFDPVKVLIFSQVVLSFALPAAIIPLLLITGRKEVMGKFANSLPVKLAGWGIALAIISLNILLLYLTLT